MSRAPFEYRVVEMTSEELATEREVWGGLADAVRRLSEASLRSTIDPDRAREITAEVHALAERLEKELLPGSFGVEVTSSGHLRGYGNAVVGLRNPIAVPLHIHHDTERGRSEARFELNALYEGPPGMVHGGVGALLLDQLAGEAAAASGHPGMTGTLTLRYRRPTPLGAVSGAAWLDHVEGVKALVKGELRDADGNLTIECEGLFILPRWAREALDGNSPPRYE